MADIERCLLDSMKQFSQAVHEIQTMDSMAGRDQWVNRLHPLVKLFITVFYIATVVSFPRYEPVGMLGMCIYPILLFSAAELSFREALYRLRIVLPVVCAVGIWNPLFDRTAYIQAGNFTVTGGMVSMLTLIAKGIFTVLAAYLLIATTSIEKICYALRLLHVPKLLVTQILLSYRYITVLLAEAERMSQAYALRAPGQKGIHYKAWGSFLGGLLLRSMDRAQELYESMCVRGYRGEFYYGNRQRVRAADIAYLLIAAAGMLLFRLVPVFELVGSLFV